MSAKPAKKGARKAAAVPSPNPAGPAAAGTPAAVPAAPAEAAVPAIESADPRRRRRAQIVLAAVWIYVGALWLLALDQTFDWGIFGPSVPPTP